MKEGFISAAVVLCAMLLIIMITGYAAKTEVVAVDADTNIKAVVYDQGARVAVMYSINVPGGSQRQHGVDIPRSNTQHHTAMRIAGTMAHWIDTVPELSGIRRPAWRQVYQAIHKVDS